MATKKAQIIGQVFIYVLGVVIISAILLFGYKATSSLLSNDAKISLLSLQKDITSSIDGIISDYGSLRTKEFSLGTNDKVCFAETTRPYDPADIPSAITTAHPLIADSLRSKSGMNVFVLKGTSIEKAFLTKNITLDQSNGDFNQFDILTCPPVVSGKMTVKFESMGDHVKIIWP